VHVVGGVLARGKQQLNKKRAEKVVEAIFDRPSTSSTIYGLLTDNGLKGT